MRKVMTTKSCYKIVINSNFMITISNESENIYRKLFNRNLFQIKKLSLMEDWKNFVKIQTFICRIRYILAIYVNICPWKMSLEGKPKACLKHTLGRPNKAIFLYLRRSCTEIDYYSNFGNWTGNILLANNYSL